MLNKKIQEEVIEKWKHDSFDLSFTKKDDDAQDRYKEMSICRLKDFLKENIQAVILSKVCRKIKGLNYNALYFMLKEIKIKGKVLPFTDNDYLPSIGNLCAILINVKDCKRLLACFGLSKKEISSAVYGSLFNVQDYNNFLLKKHRIESEERIKNDKYFEDISLESISYYKKEYVSEHKYAADFLQEYVEQNKANATDGEKAMKDVLEKNGIAFEFQKPCLVCGKSYIMDFFLPNYGVCIEVDGGYHDTQEQLIKDRERTNRLAMTGILVVRFTNEEALDRRKVKHFIDNVLQRTI